MYIYIYIYIYIYTHAILLRYGCAKPKTTATLIFRKHLFLFQQAFKQKCVLFHCFTYRARHNM